MKKKKLRALSLLLVCSLTTGLMLTSCKPSGGGSETSEATVTSESTVPGGEVVQYESKEVPKLSVYIDETAEGYATIEEMNTDHFHEAKCTGTLDLDIPEGYTCDYTDAALESMHDVTLDYIRGRGNSTWTSADKKPYKIKLDEKMNLFGMGENKEWGLIASRYDTVFLRNRCTYYLGDQMGIAFTPQCVPVEFYMNDEYLGLYLLSELVDVDEDRVEINELTPKDTSDDAITGGYLFSVMCEEYAMLEPGGNVIQTNAGVTFLAKTPSFDPEDGDVCKEQKEYLSNYLQETEDAILGNADNIGDYIDLQSAADYWWIQEFIKNEDGFLTTSSYMYKEKDGKIKFGPLWDFDGAYDYSFYDPRPVDGFNNTSMLWLDHLRQENPEFQALLKERYEVFDAAVEDLVKEGGVIDRYAGENRDAWEKDHEKWGYIERDAFEETEEEPEWMNMTYDEVVEVFRKWINDRRDWVKTNYNDITKVYTDVTFETEDGETYDVVSGVRLGSFMENAPKIGPEKEDFIFADWISKDDNTSIWEKEITEGCIFVPEYIQADQTEPAEEIRFGVRSISMPAGMENYVPAYVTLPYEAQDVRMDWKSNDEKIATVDERGRITAVAPGDTVITAMLKSGASDTLAIHVYDVKDEETVPEIKVLADDKMTLKTGESCYIELDFDAGNSRPRNAQFKCNSKDEEVATVDENGKVTAVAPGETTIVIRPIRGGIEYERVRVDIKVK